VCSIIGRVSFVKLRTRPDLTPLFGPLSPEEQQRILDLLLGVDERLTALAEAASLHVGVPYKHTGLDLWTGAGDPDISGGPSGDAGDIWFEIQMPFDDSTGTSYPPPPWIVDSRVIVFCADPQQFEDPPTHVLAGVVTEADTPTAAVETLAAHVDTLRLEILNRKASEFTASLHANLVAGEDAQRRT